MTEPWQSYTPEINAVRMETGTGPATYVAAAGAFTALAANFEIQNATLLANAAGQDALWPGLTVAARQAKIAAYSAWLQLMVAECTRMSAACAMVAEAYTANLAGQIPSQVSLQNRVDQAIAVATDFAGFNQPIITFLDTTYVEFWMQNAAQMSLYDATVMTASAPVPKPPPPPLVNPAEPALEAAQQAVASMAQNTAGSVTNQQPMDPSQFMQPVQSAMSAPGQLMQPFQQAFSAPQQMMQQFMSSLNGLGDGMGASSGLDGGAFSPMAGTLGGGAGSAGLGSAGGGGLGGGGVGGLRPPLSPAANLTGGGGNGVPNNQSLTGGGPKTAVPAASSAMPGGGGMGGGLGGAGMRGEGGRDTGAGTPIEAGVVNVADTDTARANDILAQWLPRRSGRID